MEISEETRKKAMEFQNLQQQLQIVGMQRQQMQMQAIEIDKANEELAKLKPGEKAYRAAGGILVPQDKEEITKELAGEKELVSTRTAALQKQEDKTTKRLLELQKELEGSFGKKKSDAS